MILTSFSDLFDPQKFRPYDPSQEPIFPPGVNLTNILRAAFCTKVLKYESFLYESLLRSFSLITVRLCIFCQNNNGAKPDCKMLVKLTTQSCVLTRMSSPRNVSSSRVSECFG
jgi:hypothetical protein